MEHITDRRIDRSRPTAITLGNFDGLHQGHRALIHLTKEFAAVSPLKEMGYAKNLRRKKIWKVSYFLFLRIRCWSFRKKRILR